MEELESLHRLQESGEMEEDDNDEIWGPLSVAARSTRELGRRISSVSPDLRAGEADGDAAPNPRLQMTAPVTHLHAAAAQTSKKAEGRSSEKVAAEVDEDATTDEDVVANEDPRSVESLQPATTRPSRRRRPTSTQQVVDVTAPENQLACRQRSRSRL